GYPNRLWKAVVAQAKFLRWCRLILDLDLIHRDVPIGRSVQPRDGLLEFRHQRQTVRPGCISDLAEDSRFGKWDLRSRTGSKISKLVGAYTPSRFRGHLEPAEDLVACPTHAVVGLWLARSCSELRADDRHPVAVPVGE